jgi:hypothetical protein
MKLLSLFNTPEITAFDSAAPNYIIDKEAFVAFTQIMYKMPVVSTRTGQISDSMHCQQFKEIKKAINLPGYRIVSSVPVKLIAGQSALFAGYES